MRICFLGVGEAFDEHYPNTSLLISFPKLDGGFHVLLDCGFTAPAAYYLHAPEDARSGSGLDAIWISHFHGDHFLGLPLLLLRFWEEGRTRPLVVVGQVGVEGKVWSAFELAYPGFRSRLQYPVQFLEAAPGATLEAVGARWSFALGDHSAMTPCLAVRLDCGGGSVMYSGDGRPTPATAELARDVGLLVHEAYGLDPDTPGHGGVPGCLDLARDVRARNLALVHVNRRVRRVSAGTIRAMLAQAIGEQGFLPEPGDVITLERGPDHG
jgi:ribonuclease Z